MKIIKGYLCVVAKLLNTYVADVLDDSEPSYISIVEQLVMVVGLTGFTVSDKTLPIPTQAVKISDIRAPTIAHCKKKCKI